VGEKDRSMISVPKEILEMRDDDPRLLKFMDEVDEVRRKRYFKKIFKDR